jgi:hypothetical protein
MARMNAKTTTADFNGANVDRFRKAEPKQSVNVKLRANDITESPRQEPISLE